MAEARINETRERPQGPLKITTTMAFGSVWLTSRIREFLELYPDIDVSLVLTDEELDLSMREADVAIRMTPPRQPGLIQRRLLTMHHHIYAAPEYLNEHGEPKHVDDLENHKLIVYGDAAHPPISGLNWLLELGADTGVKRRAVLKVNSAYAIFRAVQSGLGLGALPDYIGQDAGNLVQVMPDLEGPSVDVYFAYPEELRNSKRIGVFRDFLVQKINHDHP